MKKLCIGTFLHILAKAKSGKQGSLFGAVFKSISNDDKYKEPTNQNHYKSGHDNLDNDFITDCKNSDKDILQKYFASKIIAELHKDLHRNIVIAIKEVLKDDNDINPLVIIGYDEGYTKQDIINSTYFDFAELLTNVFYYCVTKVKNKPYQENIKEMKDLELHQYDEESKLIHFNEKLKKVKSSLKSTIKSKQFNDTFTEVNTGSKLCLPNNNELRTFHLDVIDNEFDYTRIKKLIRSNIGRYVFSRSKRNQYDVPDDIEDLTADAILAYKKRTSKTLETRHFSEIMLYSFLEGILDAPKIFSKIELVNISDDEYQSISSGIHLLSYSNGITPYNQLVFGTASTIDTLKDAIDKTFIQIANIKENKSEELHLVESTILNNTYDSELNNKLKDILIPKKETGANKPDTAFGIFLGYTIEISNSDALTNEEYRAALSEKMKSDIINITPYINDKITSLGLKSHSFYVYVLPLNSATIDQEEIMQKALEV